MADKLPKAVVGYLHSAGTDYQCRDCAAFLPKERGCAFHHRAVDISPIGTCILFLRGRPETYTVRPTMPLIKAESGYAEAKAGFTCGRCEYFLAATEDCQKVDRDSPGDDIGVIRKGACCNAWSQL